VIALAVGLFVATSDPVLRDCSVFAGLRYRSTVRLGGFTNNHTQVRAYFVKFAPVGAGALTCLPKWVPSDEGVRNVLCGEKQRARARNWVPRPALSKVRTRMRFAVKFAPAAIIALAPVMLAVPATAQGVQLPCSTYLYPFRGWRWPPTSDSFSIAKYVCKGP